VIARQFNTINIKVYKLSINKRLYWRLKEYTDVEQHIFIRGRKFHSSGPSQWCSQLLAVALAVWHGLLLLKYTALSMQQSLSVQDMPSMRRHAYMTWLSLFNNVQTSDAYGSIDVEKRSRKKNKNVRKRKKT